MCCVLCAVHCALYVVCCVLCVVCCVLPGVCPVLCVVCGVLWVAWCVVIRGAVCVLCDGWCGWFGV